MSFLTLLRLIYTTQNTLSGVRAFNIVNVDAYRLGMATKWKLIRSKSWAEVSNSGFDVVMGTWQK